MESKLESKKSSFDENYKQAEKLEKNEYKRNKKEKTNFVGDVEDLKRKQPVLKDFDSGYIVDFIEIVIYLLDNFSLKDEELKVKEQQKDKFYNYITLIQNTIDVYVERILFYLYAMNGDNETDRFSLIEQLLKVLLRNLDYFESFTFVNSPYIFGERYTLIDIILFASLSKLYIYFLDATIRDCCLPETTKWFSSLLALEEISSFHGQFNFCITSHISLYENLIKKDMTNIMINEEKFNHEFSMADLLECFSRLLALRRQNSQDLEQDYYVPGIIKKGSKFIRSKSNEIYENCEYIDDIELLKIKIEDTLLKNFKTEDYSVWLFDYITEEEPEDTSHESENQQLKKFFFELKEKFEETTLPSINYMTIYSNCEDNSREDDYNLSFEECPIHSPKVFLSKNLRGFVIVEGKKPHNFLNELESLDQIILMNKKEEDAVDFLMEFIGREEKFSFERIYEEEVGGFVK